MTISTRLLMAVTLMAAGALSFAQQGKGNHCTPEGVWYGGSAVAYRMTIIPAGPAGHYVTLAEGMYKDSVMTTMYAGEMTKSGNKFEGTLMALNTQDPAYTGAPPYQNLPDIAAGSFFVEMINCNTLRNTLPFYGLYFGSQIWKPGTASTGISWVASGKVPLFDPPDVDLIVAITGDTKPIVETYHRIARTVNPALLH